jgi:hypothetical protein
MHRGWCAIAAAESATAGAAATTAIARVLAAKSRLHGAVVAEQIALLQSVNELVREHQTNQYLHMRLCCWCSIYRSVWASVCPLCVKLCVKLLA